MTSPKPQARQPATGQRVIALPGTHNLRDMGGYATAGGAATRWHRLWRADSPHRLTPQAQAQLVTQGLGTVIDLRTEGEVAAAPNPFSSDTRVAYVNLPVFDALAPGSLLRLKTPQSDPLLPFYRSALDDRHEALRVILTAIAAAPPGAVMFHCTLGKDRTGIVAALLLGLAGVAPEDIVADYTLTEPLTRNLVEDLIAQAAAHNMDAVAYRRLMGAPATAMQTTLGHLTTRYGSVGGYLDAIGLPAGDRAALTDRLLSEREAPAPTRPAPPPLQG